MAEMDKLTIEVEANTTNAIDGLKSLKKTLNKLKKATEELKGIDVEGVGRIYSLAGAVDSLTQATTSGDFETTIRNLRRLTHLDFSNLTGIDGTLSRLSDLLGRTGNQPQNRPVTPTTVPKTSVSSNREIQESISYWQQFKDVLKAVPAIVGVVMSALWKSIKFVGGIGKVVLSTAGKILKFAWAHSVAHSAIKGFGDSVKNASKGLGGFLKKIAGMAKTRMLRKMISAVTEGIKEGIQNLYRWSHAMGGSFAKSMDQGYTALSYFKNSIGAAVAPLVTAFIPILDAAIDKVVQFINSINQLFAKLTGASSWTKAVKQSRSYSENLSNASGAAESLNETLAGFDELNLITSESGGGGGSKLNPDYSGMFEEVKEFDSNTEDIFDRIANAFQNGRWAELGITISEGFNGLIEDIPWEDIGDSMGEKITGVVETLASFLKYGNFVGLGKKIAALIRKTVRRIDFTSVGTILVRKLTAKFDTAIGMLSDTELWGSAGKAIGDLFRGTFDETGNWVSGINWTEVADNLKVGLVAAIDGMNITGIAESFSGLIEKALAAVSEYLDSNILETLVKNIGVWLEEAIRGFDLKGIWEELSLVIMKIGAHIAPLLMELVATIVGVIASGLEEMGVSTNWLRDKQSQLQNNASELLATSLAAIRQRETEKDNYSALESAGLDKFTATLNDVISLARAGAITEETAKNLAEIVQSRLLWDSNYDPKRTSMTFTPRDGSFAPTTPVIPSTVNGMSDGDRAVPQWVVTKMDTLIQQMVQVNQNLDGYSKRPVNVNVYPSSAWGVHGAASGYKAAKIFGTP